MRKIGHFGIWVAGIVALAGGVSLAGPQSGDGDATADPRIDSATGRELAHYPPSRGFDHKHMKLSVTIPDMAEARLTGIEELTLAAIGTPRPEVVLSSIGPEVEEVTLGRTACGFTVEGGKLRITLPEPAGVGQEFTLRIAYAVDFSANRGEGLVWVKPRAEDPSETQTNPQIYSQGEAESNSRWYPCHDFPNERLTTELVVDVEDGYEVLSNGRLVEKTPGAAGRTVWHWLQDKAHVNYLVCLYVGKCAIVEVGGETTARPGLSMPVYAPLGREERAKEAFADLPAMVAFYERYFGVPYPWDKCAQACIRTFNGGMENTSAIFYTAQGVMRGEGRADDLICHELAHQWTGDYITCKSWEHLWLNEGWATFCEALWAQEHSRLEHAGEPDEPALSRQAYEREVSGLIRAQRRINRTSAPGSIAVASNRYANADAVFAKVENVYSKGPVLIHMLRERLGHETFDAGVKVYMKRFGMGLAETDDFRRVMEDVSGQSLELFFNQWFKRPGMARVKVSQRYDEGEKALTLTIEQTQTIDGYNPAYDMDVPVLVTQVGGAKRWVHVRSDQRKVEATFTLDAQPTDVSVDPYVTNFAAWTVDKSVAMFLHELRDGETVMARAAARERLAAEGSIEALAALTREAARGELGATGIEDVQDCVLAGIARGLGGGGVLAVAAPQGASVEHRALAQSK